MKSPPAGWLRSHCRRNHHFFWGKNGQNTMIKKLGYELTYAFGGLYPLLTIVSDQGSLSEGALKCRLVVKAHATISEHVMS